MEPDDHPAPIPPVENDGVVYNGTWERSGRSINGAAILALLGIGVLYFNIQSILMVLVIAVSPKSIASPDATFSSIENIARFIEAHKSGIRIVIVTTQFLCMLFPVLLLVKRWHTTDVRKYIRLRGCSVLEIFLAIAGTMMIMPSGVYIGNAIIQLFHIPHQFSKINETLVTASSPWEFVWLVIVIAVTPAICEEIFFRGYVQRTLERTIAWKSVFVVGVIFGLFHFQPLGLITLSILGLVFGYFSYRSKSLLPNMAAHFTNNAIVVWIAYSVSRGGMPEEPMEGQIPIAFVLVTFVLGAGILVLYHFVTEKNFTAAEYQPSTV